MKTSHVAFLVLTSVIVGIILSMMIQSKLNNSNVKKDVKIDEPITVGTVLDPSIFSGGMDTNPLTSTSTSEPVQQVQPVETPTKIAVQAPVGSGTRWTPI